VVNVFYRISSSSYNKGKLPGATKEVCLRNFLETFPQDEHPFTILADNCDDSTTAMVHSLCRGTTIRETSLGNAGSFRRAGELALDLPDDAVVYFVEDDYLHLTSNDPYFPCNPPLELEEGLLRADYVTLYDHPDKYLSEYSNGEITKTYRTLHTHWKYSISTTMTFATRVGTLRADWETWLRYTGEKHPKDHLIFSELRENGRTLGVRIPGTACHVDLTYGAVHRIRNSRAYRNAYMEPWVFPLVESYLAQRLFGTRDTSQFATYTTSMSPGLKRLMIIAALTNLVT